MPRTLWSCCWATALGTFLTSALASEPASSGHPVIPGFERFYATAPAADPEGGLLLLSELQCVACHTSNAPVVEALPRRQAPVLDQLGQRVRPEFLRALLSDPQQADPGTTMPDVLTGLSPQQKQQTIEALVHFLIGSGQLRETAPVTHAVARGQQLFHTVGCTACHDARDTEPTPLATSVPLGSLEQKYSIPSLTQLLLEPLHVRPSGRMPDLNLTADEARDIASYLLQNVEAEPQLQYAYYEGYWNKLPDFAELEPVERGASSAIDFSMTRRLDQFALRWESFLMVPREGEYTFLLGSDDGSRLLIDGKKVADNDAVHAFTWAQGQVRLTAGAHPLVLEYFEEHGEQQLRVEVQGPGVERQPLEFLLSATATSEAVRSDGFKADPELVAAGREAFRSFGCAACHALSEEAQRLTSTRSAPPLSSVASDEGCLAPQPALSQAPWFSLSATQRQSLRAALASLPQRSLPEPEAQIHHTLVAFNCYACHERNAKGGVETARNALFRSDMPEMGDEGRLPPLLTGVGDKLQPEWLNRVLAEGAKDRPYMFTRMPKFGGENLGHLAALLVQVDQKTSERQLEIARPDRRVKAAGRQLVGDQGYGCIKCHTFGDSKATGIQSISMTTMTGRLREDWFHRYLLDPQAYRPGTRMPAAWPEGQVLLPAIMDGDAHKQIHAIWAYLSDGEQAAKPLGLEQSQIELVADKEPRIYRNFIAGAGPRGVAVGYPEKVNLAFDPDRLRIAMLWHGAFIDASMHWTARGSGFQGPLGDNVLQLDAGLPVAQLASADAAWPDQSARELGHAFLGYRLDDQRRPVFRYQLHDVLVEDAVAPLSEPPFTPVRRQLTFTSPHTPSQLYFRAAAASKIEQEDSHTYLIDGSWKIVLKSSSTPLIRSSGGRTELLVPIIFEDGKAEILQEIHW